jgi:hypothetical protein
MKSRDIKGKWRAFMVKEESFGNMSQVIPVQW